MLGPALKFKPVPTGGRLRHTEVALAAAIWEAQRMLASWRSTSEPDPRILLVGLQTVLCSSDVAQALDKVSNEEAETPDCG